MTKLKRQRNLVNILFISFVLVSLLKYIDFKKNFILSIFNLLYRGFSRILGVFQPRPYLYCLIIRREAETLNSLTYIECRRRVCIRDIILILNLKCYYGEFFFAFLYFFILSSRKKIYKISNLKT